MRHPCPKLLWLSNLDIFTTLIFTLLYYLNKIIDPPPRALTSLVERFLWWWNNYPNKWNPLSVLNFSYINFFSAHDSLSIYPLHIRQAKIPGQGEFVADGWSEEVTIVMTSEWVSNFCWLKIIDLCVREMCKNDRKKTLNKFCSCKTATRGHEKKVPKIKTLTLKPL